MNSKKYSTEILKKQLQDLMKSTDLGFSVGLVDDNDFYKWTVCFTGPEDTIYEGGFFKAILTFPDDFPQNPPEMKFITEMWHPNIYPDGRVCISILHPPGVDRFNEQETAEEVEDQHGGRHDDVVSQGAREGRKAGKAPRAPGEKAQVDTRWHKGSRCE